MEDCGERAGVFHDRLSFEAAVGGSVAGPTAGTARRGGRLAGRLRLSICTVSHINVMVGNQRSRVTSQDDPKG